MGLLPYAVSFGVLAIGFVLTTIVINVAWFDIGPVETLQRLPDSMGYIVPLFVPPWFVSLLAFERASSGVSRMGNQPRSIDRRDFWFAVISGMLMTGMGLSIGYLVGTGAIT